MALLRTRGGGLLATGPDAVRANAMRQQQTLLQAARAPNVMRAPMTVINEENPLNQIGPGLEKIGGFLGDMAADRRRQTALQASRAPIETTSMRTVQPAGFFIKDGIEIDPREAFLSDELNQAFLNEAIQMNDRPEIERLTGSKFREAVRKRVTSQREPTLQEQAARLFQAGFRQEAQDLLSAVKVRQEAREAGLREELREAYENGDLEKARSIVLQLPGNSAIQAFAQASFKDNDGRAAQNGLRRLQSQAYGRPPRGFVFALDENGDYILEDVPGQPGLKKPKLVSLKARTGEASPAQKILYEEINRSIDILMESGGMAAGFGALLQIVPYSSSKELAGLLKTIRVQVGFDRLQDMRNNSPTGGALGPISNFENRLLQATLGNLDQSQTPEILIRNLNRLRLVVEGIVHGTGPFGQLERGQPDSLTRRTPAIDDASAREDLYRRYGLTPEKG